MGEALPAAGRGEGKGCGDPAARREAIPIARGASRRPHGAIVEGSLVPELVEVMAAVLME